MSISTNTVLFYALYGVFAFSIGFFLSYNPNNNLNEQLLAPLSSCSTPASSSSSPSLTSVFDDTLSSPTTGSSCPVCPPCSTPSSPSSQTYFPNPLSVRCPPCQHEDTNKHQCPVCPTCIDKVCPTSDTKNTATAYLPTTSLTQTPAVNSILLSLNTISYAFPSSIVSNYFTPTAFLSPDDPYYDILSSYLTAHSAAAIAQLTSPTAICGLTFIAHTCCDANFGTTIMRMLATIKLGIQLNRTVVVDVPPEHEDGAEYFLWNLPTLKMIKHKLRINGCPLKENKDEMQVLTLPQIGHRKMIPTILNPEFDVSTCAQYTEFSVYTILRCHDVFPTFKRYIKLQVADNFAFHALIHYNKHYQASPISSLYFPLHRYPTLPSLHTSLYYAFAHISPALESVLQTFSQNKLFDVMIHLRTKRPHHVYPFITATTIAYQELLANTAQPSFAPRPSVFTSAPPNVKDLPPITERPFRVFVTSAQYDPKLFCTYLKGNITAIQATQQVECFYFDAVEYLNRYTLPADLTLHQIIPMPDDWGIAPTWAAIINIHMARYLAYKLLCITESSYCAMMRLISGKESHDANNKLNDRGPFWPF